MTYECYHDLDNLSPSNALLLSTSWLSSAAAQDAASRRRVVDLVRGCGICRPGSFRLTYFALRDHEEAADR